MVKDLAYGSDENNNYCHFTENNPSDDNVMLDKSTTREGHTSLPAGKSKWNRFLKVDSNDDNGKLFFCMFVNLPEGSHILSDLSGQKCQNCRFSVAK